MKNLLLSLFLIFISTALISQVPTPNLADGQQVCPNTISIYGDQVINPTSTYSFSILPVQLFTTIGQQIQVTWTTPGIYTMTMVETNAAGCQVTTTADITVLTNVTATINPIVVCQDASAVNITGQNLGTTPVYSGTGVTGTTFNPAGLLPGNYNISITSLTASGCAITGAGVATVEPLPTGIIYTD